MQDIFPLVYLPKNEETPITYDNKVTENDV